MKVKLLFFAKIKLSESSYKVLFAVHNDVLPSASLVKNSLKDLVKKNKLLRHEKFDWHINKNIKSRVLLEISEEDEMKLPLQIDLFGNKININWYVFPKAVKLLHDGNEKNFLQLAVQYISNGGIDENVIAADYDEDFLKTLQRKLTDDNN